MTPTPFAKATNAHLFAHGNHARALEENDVWDRFYAPYASEPLRRRGAGQVRGSFDVGAFIVGRIMDGEDPRSGIGRTLPGQECRAPMPYDIIRDAICAAMGPRRPRVEEWGEPEPEPVAKRPAPKPAPAPPTAPKRRGRGRPPVPAETVAAIRKLRETGWSYARIGRAVGVSDVTAMKYAR